MQGFYRVSARISDTELDCPGAQQQLDSLASAAIAAGLLDKDWAAQAAPSAASAQPALAPQVCCSLQSFMWATLHYQVLGAMKEVMPTCPSAVVSSTALRHHHRGLLESLVDCWHVVESKQTQGGHAF